VRRPGLVTNLRWALVRVSWWAVRTWDRAWDLWDAWMLTAGMNRSRRASGSPSLFRATDLTPTPIPGAWTHRASPFGTLGGEAFEVRDGFVFIGASSALVGCEANDALLAEAYIEDVLGAHVMGEAA
jgi:hypothetical protein